MKCILRKGYGVLWLGKTYKSGEVIDIPEEEYKKKPHIYEPQEYTDLVLGKEKAVELEPVKEEEPTVKDMAGDSVAHRAIVTPHVVRRRK